MTLPATRINSTKVSKVSKLLTLFQITKLMSFDRKKYSEASKQKLHFNFFVKRSVQKLNL